MKPGALWRTLIRFSTVLEIRRTAEFLIKTMSLHTYELQRAVYLVKDNSRNTVLFVR